jgi:S-adenosylmethionine:tRNA ribosyltransferase-isomerase
LRELTARGVKVETITLHVGLGTFLPVTVENLGDHSMHSESVTIPARAWQSVTEARERGFRIWALGTTVTRSLESAQASLLHGNAEQGFSGETNLFIKPGHDWQIVSGLLTNFHQPRSTLIALVAAFAGLQTVREAYAWAIERKFRLFSYGDLTAWTR